VIPTQLKLQRQIPDTDLIWEFLIGPVIDLQFILAERVLTAKLQQKMCVVKPAVTVSRLYRRAVSIATILAASNCVPGLNRDNHRKMTTPPFALGSVGLFFVTSPRLIGAL
jgi:hypothetical protein